MKKIYNLLVLAVFAIAPAMAQVENITETSCDAESRTLYDVLDSGKAVLVASDGFDCGICMNHAQDVVEIADAYEGKLEVWAGMVNIYSMEETTCENIDGWRTTFEWDNIFMFLDQDENWFLGGTPVYYLIHPDTKEIYYQGSSMPQVKAAVAAVIGYGLSVDETSIEEAFNFSIANNQIHLNATTNLAQEAAFALYDINGRLLFQENISLNKGQNTVSVNISERLSSGIYLGVVETKAGKFSSKLLY